MTREAGDVDTATAALTVGVVGAGRLGSTLALALQAAGVPLPVVASRSTASAAALAERLQGAEAVTLQVLPTRCDMVVLAVPDDALTEVAGRLPLSAGQRVVHLSGALPLSVLASARAVGALAGCLHPLQSFPRRFGSPRRFVGIACGVEGDGELGDELATLVARLGARSISLSGVDRARYHAAAVFASNYLVALHVAAETAFELAGLPREVAKDALAPLTRGALDNVQNLPLSQALTGPVARGDVATVRAHLEAFGEAPGLGALYRHLALQLLELPLQISPPARAALEALLADAPGSA